MWWLLIPLFMSEQKAAIGAIELVIVLVVFGSGLISSFIHYSTLRYRLHEGMLEIRYGLLNRRSRRLDPQRIQNLELVKNPLHKAAGLVELRVETAGEAREDGLLSALTEEEATRLRAAIEEARSGASPEEAIPDEQEILRVSFTELLAFGLSASLRTYAISLALVFAAVEVLRDSGSGIVKDLSHQLGPTFIVAVGAIALFVAFLSVVIKGIVRHWDHRLVRDPKGMRTEEGLFTRRKVEIPRRKVQVVKVREPFIRRLMGYGTVHVETAGLGSIKEGIFSAETAIPMVHRDELQEALQAVSPELDIDPWSVKLKQPAKRALYRARIASFLEVSPAIIVLAIVFFPWGLLSLLLLPWVFFVTRLDWSRQGWALSDGYLVVQRGILLRETRVMALEKVQALHLHQGPLMRWLEIARLHVFVADAQVSLPDLDEPLCEQLFESLAESTKAA